MNLIYRASDGAEFDNEEACKQHEAVLAMEPRIEYQLKQDNVSTRSLATYTKLIMRWESVRKAALATAPPETAPSEDSAPA